LMSAYGIDGERALALLRRLGPARLGGSEREREAAAVLAAEIRGLGLHPVVESFPAPTFADAEATLKVIDPPMGELACEPVGLAGQTPPEGVEGELVFVESGGGAYLATSTGKVALLYGFLDRRKYEDLLRVGVAGLICIGEPGRPAALYHLMADWAALGAAPPAVNVAFETGLRLVRAGASRVRLYARQRVTEGESVNVMVDVPGTGRADEVIVVGAHLDSLRDMDGAHDNGAGTVAAMEILRYFAAHPARRTLRFVWFGSEELGWLGSQAYVHRHAAELDQVRLMVNLDVGGGLLGQDAVDVMGPPELTAFFELWDREAGLGLLIREKVYGGDNGPFAEQGVPAVTIHRREGTALYIHTPGDRLDWVDGRHLARLAEQAATVVDRTANSFQFLFERTVPDEIHKQIREMRDRYLGPRWSPEGEEEGQ
jgi:aminopeptidase YwaD